MPEAFLSGKLGKAKVGATDINITGWTFTHDAVELETTHSGSSGWQTFISGPKGASVEIAADWDRNAEPTASAPNLVPGAALANLILYIGDPSNDEKITAVDSIIFNITITSEVQGKVSFTATVRPTGPIVMPT